MKKISGWHFSTGKLGYADGRTIVAGETYTQEYPDRGFDKPTLCGSGMHASVRLIDALSYAPGLILSRVTLLGEITLSGDKMVAASRRHEWLVDASEIVVRWAFWCADRAVHIHAPAQLRAAGLVAEAEKLEKLPEIIDQTTAEVAAEAAEAAWAAARAAARAAAEAAEAAWAAAEAAEAAWAAAEAAEAAWAAARAAVWAAEAAGAAEAAEAVEAAEGKLQEAKLVEMVENAR